MPQLNPEFFISQLFWLVLTFSFLFIFLWRISLPRINTVLKKREGKINDDINAAKKLQAEAEEIQAKIDQKLNDVKSKTADMIKKTTFNLQNNISKELGSLDKKLNIKIEESSLKIESDKIDSLKKIHEQFYQITKLTLSKISNITFNDDEIKKVVDEIHKRESH